MTPVSIPASLQSALQQAQEQLHSELAALAPKDQQAAVRVLAASRFVREWCQRWPGQMGGMLHGDLPDLPQTKEQSEFDAALRRRRNQAMVRIAWREIAAEVTAQQTVEALSDLADECLQAAVNWHLAAMQQRHGVARLRDGSQAQFAVIALGKLGGRELNFSSDVDVLFAYSGAGESDGAKPLANEQYFVRLGQRVVASMQDISEFGFVFRVDLRLRPFGEKSPLSHSLASLEEYYEAHGREWERYAWIKARAVAGDMVTARALIADLQPFVYRGYLDYGSIAALRDMKEQIDEQVRKRGHEQDIKLGWGGIREVEFVVQVFQLVRGGAEPSLRSNRITQAMAAIDALGLHDSEQIAQLREAYWFLRRVENCWQAQQDQQSHVLPNDELPRQALALAVGFSDWSELDARLQHFRAIVHAQFAELFATPDVHQEEDARWAPWWAGGDAPVPAAFGATALQALRDKAHKRLQHAQDRARVGELLSMLNAQFADPATAERVLDVVAKLIGRGNYISLLLDSAVARRELLNLCGRSAWLATEIRQFPMVLAELLDPIRLYAPDERATLRSQLQAHLQSLPESDVEARMDVLRRLRHTTMLRIAAADVSAALPIMRVSDRLSELAEEILSAALGEAVLQMRQRFPELPELDFAVIAYGKLGGLELGYSSDLDLVFVYDAGQNNLPRDPAWFYTRLAQKLIHFLATPTGAGTAYEIDTRLRPSGKSGLLVTSVQGLEKYQREQAWTWEHQALIRARSVAGSARVGEAFEALRRNILCSPRERSQLLAEVREMREKMRQELAPKDGSFHPKHSPGGIIDIEFFVQYAVLAHAHEHPEICRFTDVIRVLESMRTAKLLDAADAEALADAYRRIRSLVHMRFLSGAHGTQEAEAGARALAQTTQSLLARLYQL